MNIKKYFYFLSVFVVFGTLVVAVPALADNSAPDAGNHPAGWAHGVGLGREMMGIVGTVSVINGNTVTVIQKRGFGANQTSTTFTVDVTNAKIMKGGAAITVSNIAVGDTIVVLGTINGTNVVATSIRDGLARGGEGHKLPAQNLSPITGNGEPVVAGTVSGVNGSMISITNKSNVSYTVDATNAKITKGPNTITISNVAIGDMVVVQGTVNGNSVVASSVIDQARPAGADNNASGATPPRHKGFFGSIGSFFLHIFGF